MENKTMACTDSRGAEMPDMSCSEALGIVVSMARENPTDHMDEAFGDEGMADMAEHQRMDLALLDDFEDRFVDLDTAFPEPETAGDWDGVLLAPDMKAISTDPAEAMKAALSMASGLLDAGPVQGIKEADEFGYRSQAVDIVSDLIGRHGTEISAVLSSPVPAARS